MKKVILILGALFCTIGTTYAQWTNSTDIYNTNTGNVGIGTTTPASLFSVGSLSQFQINTSGLTSLTNTTPEFRFITSADGSFARFLRGTTSSNNLFLGKNTISQAGGVGNAVSLSSINSFWSASDAGLPTGSSVAFTFAQVFKTTTTSFVYNWMMYGNSTVVKFDGTTLYVFIGGVSVFSSAVPAYSDGNWHQLIVAINGTTGDFYLDNVLIKSASLFGGTYNATLSGTYQSAFQDIGFPQEVTLDQQLFYNRALSRTSGSGGTDEIAALYNSGAYNSAPPLSGLIRRYDFDDGSGSTAADNNPSGTQYPLTLTNTYAWTSGIIPLSSSPSEVTFFSSADGVTNGEKGIATWGDFNGRNQQQGKWFQWFQGNHYPLVSDNNGHWLFNPSNTSTTLPAIASTVDVAGNITIGSGYAGVNAAPANGLLVQGNVGIGTTSPGYSLDIVGGNASITNNGNNPQYRVVDGTIITKLQSQTVGGTTGVVGTESGNDLAFITANATKMLIQNSTGNVAIGTTDPRGFKLAVNGSAIAESMTVLLHTAWPDYVFKPNYTLPSLTQVKSYIDKNQHLPEMPSEQEISEKGLNLGEMNKLLVKKVEELTLYLIEKDNQVNKQQEDIDQLKKQMEALITICSKNK